MHHRKSMLLELATRITPNQNFAQKKLDSSQTPIQAQATATESATASGKYIATVYNEEKALTSNHPSNLVALVKRGTCQNL